MDFIEQLQSLPDKIIKLTDNEVCTENCPFKKSCKGAQVDIERRAPIFICDTSKLKSIYMNIENKKIKNKSNY